MTQDSDIVITADGRRLRPVKSVSRAIEVLDIMAADGEPMGLTELATAMRCSKTAAYNVITTLELHGLVRKDSDTRYALGWRLLELGEMVRASSTFGDAASARVTALAELAGETSLVAVLDRDTALCVELAETRRSVPIAFTPGRREPLDATATGQVLIAFSSPGRRRRFIAEHDADGVGGLAQTLDRVRIAGFAALASTSDAGVVIVAAPIFDYTREVVASLAVAGPASRLTDQRTGEIADLVRREADGISRTLGSTVTLAPAASDG